MHTMPCTMTNIEVIRKWVNTPSTCNTLKGLRTPEHAQYHTETCLIRYAQSGAVTDTGTLARQCLPDRYVSPAVLCQLHKAAQ